VFTGHRTCFVPGHLKYDKNVFVPGVSHQQHPVNAYNPLVRRSKNTIMNVTAYLFSQLNTCRKPVSSHKAPFFSILGNIFKRP
jgi:hypothetical protein